jgi:hypothetical protein
VPARRRSSGATGETPSSARRVAPPAGQVPYFAAVSLPVRGLSRGNGNAPRSEAGWVSARDKLHGRAVERRRVVEMALPVIVIRWSTDERGAQPRLASKRVRGLPGAASAGVIFIAAKDPPRVASKRVRVLLGAPQPIKTSAAR